MADRDRAAPRVHPGIGVIDLEVVEERDRVQIVALTNSDEQTMRLFLKEGALSVVQCDPEWCGGTSELVKICAVASLPS